MLLLTMISLSFNCNYLIKSCVSVLTDTLTPVKGINTDQQYASLTRDSRHTVQFLGWTFQNLVLPIS